MYRTDEADNLCFAKFLVYYVCTVPLLYYLLTVYSVSTLRQVLIAVPRLYENVYQGVMQKFAAGSVVQVCISCVSR